MDCSVIFVQCWAIFTSAHPVPAARSSGSIELNKFAFSSIQTIGISSLHYFKNECLESAIFFSPFFFFLRSWGFFLFKVENYIKCKALNKETVIKPKYS